MAELWCIHVQGPDSMIPQPDRATAERRAEEWQAAFENITREPSPFDPVVKCVVVPWEGLPEDHAAELAEHGGEPEDIC